MLWDSTSVPWSLIKLPSRQNSPYISNLMQCTIWLDYLSLRVVIRKQPGYGRQSFRIPMILTRWPARIWQSTTNTRKKTYQPLWHGPNLLYAELKVIKTKVCAETTAWLRGSIDEHGCSEKSRHVPAPQFR